LPPYEYLIGLKKFESKELEGEDHKVYSLKRFLELVLMGDPQCTELLFVANDQTLRCTDIGNRVMDLKPHLLSNVVYNRIMGYSIGEWRKAMAVRLVSKEKNRTKDAVINDISNLWSPGKEVMDNIISLLDSVDEKELISSVSGLGSKRRADVEQFGYCRKSAAHSIRLLTQLMELMGCGFIAFPRPNAKLLLDIRNGLYSKEALEMIHTEMEEGAKKVRERSVLPDKPNSKAVWKEYENIVAEFLHEDKRFKILLGAKNG